MDERIRNPEKKYPIAPEQILTGRKGCEYCRQSSTSLVKPSITEKCCFCGFEPQEMI